MAPKRHRFEHEFYADAFHWQGISATTAVLWGFRDYDWGQEHFGPVGIVIWGDVTTKALAVPLSRLAPNQYGLPTYPGLVPPDADDLARDWDKHEFQRDQFAASHGSATSARSRQAKKNQAAPAGAPILMAFERRQTGESTDDFYARVAEFYIAAIPLTGKPRKALEEAAGVTKAIAARWVQEARKRGFLVQTSRGRSK